jgi:hypothetical protein
MTYDEALRFLGLTEDATEEDIKTAYHEMAQILHPDRFNANEKLRDRATEQFKHLNDARDTLLAGARGSRGTRGSRSSRTSGSYGTRAAQLDARIAGIQAAREGLVAFRDAEEDSRRNGGIMFIAGLLVGFALRRVVVLAGLGATLAVWGIVKVVSASMSIRSIDEKLAELEREKKACIKEREKL